MSDAIYHKASNYPMSPIGFTTAVTNFAIFIPQGCKYENFYCIFQINFNYLPLTNTDFYKLVYIIPII